VKKDSLLKLNSRKIGNKMVASAITGKGELPALTRV
jgi:hypothetical protein